MDSLAAHPHLLCMPRACRGACMPWGANHAARIMQSGPTRFFTHWHNLCKCGLPDVSRICPGVVHTRRDPELGPLSAKFAAALTIFGAMSPTLKAADQVQPLSGEFGLTRAGCDCFLWRCARLGLALASARPPGTAGAGGQRQHPGCGAAVSAGGRARVLSLRCWDWRAA